MILGLPKLYYIVWKIYSCMKLKIRKIIKQIRHKEFGEQRQLSLFLKPDPGFRRAARAPMCVR